MRLIKPPDRLWRLLADLCYSCAVRYDFVGRYESLQADAPDTALPLAARSSPVRPRRVSGPTCFETVSREDQRDASSFAPDRARLCRKTLATSAPTSTSPGPERGPISIQSLPVSPSIHGGRAYAACAGITGTSAPTFGSWRLAGIGMTIIGWRIPLIILIRRRCLGLERRDLGLVIGAVTVTALTADASRGTGPATAAAGTASRPGSWSACMARYPTATDGRLRCKG